MKKLPRNPCVICSQLCKRHTTITCSKECRVIRQRQRAANGERFGGPTIKLLPKPSKHCSKIFKPSHDYIQYCSKKCGSNSPKFITAAKAIGKSKKGTTYSKEIRARMSKAASNRKARTVYTKGIGGTRQDIGHYVRSTWEANYARILKLESKDYVYEPHAFTLVNDEGLEIRYRPDFLVGKEYIELKGWWTEKAKLIKRLMAEQYPNINIKYIDEKEYNVLTNSYSHKIPNWERKGGYRGNSS